jgi:hypothetical protein
MGPSVGPRKGADVYIIMASPRSLATKISKMTAAELAMDDAPKAPAKKRRTSSVPIFGLAIAAAPKTVTSVNMTPYRICRPYVSEIGAQVMGPMANPRTKSEMLATANCGDTSKSC